MAIIKIQEGKKMLSHIVQQFTVKYFRQDGTKVDNSYNEFQESLLDYLDDQ